ncbi:LCP family protein [Bacillus infantis]|uniref:LCP family protein n=1 Tax=Bacillus infantis TaxID=324767 RepID=UPI003CF953EE
MATDGRYNNKYRKKRKFRRRIFFFLFVPLLVLILAATTYGAFLYTKAQSVVDEAYNPVERNNKRETEVNPDIDNISILFAGIDDSNVRNYSEGSRTDALVLATFNEKSKSVKLLSIPRDSYVYIPSRGYKDKINHAYGEGGIASTIETIEETLEIPIDYYVNMNFNAFIEVVDALGGIEADVPYELSEKDSQDKHNAINLQPGIQQLSGEEALALARTRKQDNDIERGKRQQEIIKAVIKKAAHIGSLSKYSNVMEAIGDNMSTDLSFDEMKALLDYAAEGSSLKVETLSLAGEDGYINNGSIDVYYYLLDDDALKETKHTLKEHLGLEEALNEENDPSAHEY